MKEAIIIGSILLIVVAFIVFLLIYRKIKSKNDCFNKLKAFYKNVEITKRKEFDFIASDGDCYYLFKIIRNFSNAEINVNSKLYWQINHGAVSSRKSGEKMNNVYDLICFDESSLKLDKKVIKVHIIYPNASRIMKVLNECEMKMVTPKLDIYGTRIVKYINLEEELKQL